MDPPTAAVESRRGRDDPPLPTIDAAQRVGNDKQRRGHQSDQRNETSRVMYSAPTGDERHQLHSSRGDEVRRETDAIRISDAADSIRALPSHRET